MRTTLATLALGAITVFGSSCGDNTDNTLVPKPTPETPKPAACSFTDVAMRPATGAGPLHRHTPIAVMFKGKPGEIDFKVISQGFPMIGETIQGDSKAIFVPVSPYPENATVEYTVKACKQTVTGSFQTGALMHPLADLEGTHGTHPFDIDLRTAQIDSPQTRPMTPDVLLKWQLGPVFLVQFVRIEGESAIVAVAPGIVEDGKIKQDLRLPLQNAKVSLGENPYVSVRPQQMELALGKDTVILTDIDMVLGLTEEGLDDGRLVADVRVPERQYLPNDPADPCHQLFVQSPDGGCHACSDGNGRCFTIELSDISGAPSSVTDLVKLPLSVELPPKFDIPARNGKPIAPMPPDVPSVPSRPETPPQFK